MVTTQTPIVCHANGVPGRGPLDAEVMICGVGPAREEMRSLKAYSGQTGRLLQACLTNLGIDMDSECYITNLLCWWSKAPTLEEAAACESRLRQEINTVKPKVILALGALPITFFTGYKRSGEARGSCLWSAEFNCWIVCTWQPTVVFQVSPTLISDVMRDLKKINYIKDKAKDFGAVTYEVVRSREQAQAVLDSDWIRLARFVALDVECRWDFSTNKWTDDISCLSISDGTITYTFPEAVLAGLTWPTADVHWTFHNAMFDTQKLINDQHVDLPICDDTMLMSYSLDERGGTEEDDVDIAVGIHNLKRLAREWCGAGFYDSAVDLKTSPESILYEYNAKDAAYTARLAILFEQWQIADDMRDFYLRMILPEARICRDEKAFGIYIDSAKVNQLAITWSEEWLKLEDELAEEAVALGWQSDKRFNFNSTQQVKKFLNVNLHLPVENTQADTLEAYADNPWVAKRIRIKRIDKQLNTYVVGIQNAIEVGSRVHPEPSIHATTSGRKAYHKPPVGTIPTGAQYVDPDEAPDEATVLMIKEFSQIRGLFSAPPGKVFIEADYSAAELWTAALTAHDDTMLNDLMSGDFHSRASESMFQCKQSDYDPAQWKNIRRESKYVTFGVLFFRGARSLFSPKAGQGGNLGKKYSLPQIEAMVRAWHQRYHVHYEWALEEVKLARQRGWQRSITGRKRRYYAPGVYGGNFDNMAVNWPIQSVAHDHLIAARLEWASLVRPAQSLFDGHDAIYFECDANKVAEAVAQIKVVMERPRWFDIGLPVSIKVGPNWSEGKVVA